MFDEIELRTMHHGLNLQEIQFEVRKWLDHNFPDTAKPANQFAGIVEEVGELATFVLGDSLDIDSRIAKLALRMHSLGIDAHATLKALQGIRE